LSSPVEGSKARNCELFHFRTYQSRVGFITPSWARAVGVQGDGNDSRKTNSGLWLVHTRGLNSGLHHYHSPFIPQDFACPPQSGDFNPQVAGTWSNVFGCLAVCQFAPLTLPKSAQTCNTETKSRVHRKPPWLGIVPLQRVPIVRQTRGSSLPRCQLVEVSGPKERQPPRFTAIDNTGPFLFFFSFYVGFSTSPPSPRTLFPSQVKREVGSDHIWASLH
jgi:hypothetical protein